MSGVLPSELAGNDFVQVHLDLVDKLGGSLEAALLLARIHYRAGADGWWTATRAEVMADTRLSEYKCKQAMTLLREHGFVETERVSTLNATLRYRVAVDREGGGLHPEKEVASISQKDATSISSSKNVRTKTSSVTAGEPSPSTLFAVPEPEPKPQSKHRRLVEVWMEGWATTEHETVKPTALIPRVTRKIKEVLEAGVPDSKWPEVEAAVRRAGVMGAWDVAAVIHQPDWSKQAPPPRPDKEQTFDALGRVPSAQIVVS